MNLAFFKFGDRYYDSDISIWLSVDPLAQERSWLSPYNYCQLNPISRIDPTGALDDHYTVDKAGNIELVQKTKDNFDVIHTKSNWDKGVKDKGVKVYDNNILSQLRNSKLLNVDDSYWTQEEGFVKSSSSEKLRVASSSKRKDMISLWLFLCNNTSSEWRLDFNKDNSYRLSTLHLSSTAPNDDHLGVKANTIKWVAHSHPRTATDAYYEHVSMTGDYYTSSNYTGFHVYFPNSKNLYSLFGINSTNGKARRSGPFKTNGTYNSINPYLK